MEKSKRKTRPCSKCHYRQYYRKTRDDWRCDRCGFISNGPKEVKKYELISSEVIPPKQISPMRSKMIEILQEFWNREPKISYIQFNDLIELKRISANLRSATIAIKMSVRVSRYSHLLRVYLEKL